MAATARLLETGVLKGKVGAALRTFLSGIERWRAQLGTDGHVITLDTLLDESGYIAMWQQDKSPEAPGRIENLRELVRALADFETLDGFLDHVSLVMENEEQGETDRISMMTLHAAKGLEFDTVFLPGWEEGLFPSQRTMDESGLKGLEEERRLAYVGITRARKTCVISHAANRRLYANWQMSIPSRFLDELPDDAIETEGGHDVERARMLQAPVFTSAFPLTARKPLPGAWEQPARPKRDSGYAIGARVFHEKFGPGTVLAVDDDKLEIDFDKAGTRKVIDRFVEPA
jgi:DNA helicase-2/ATP-dependent DNA helicase PcrA